MTKTLSLYEGDVGRSATTDFLRKTVRTDCLRIVKGLSLGRGLVANWVLAGQEQLKQLEKAKQNVEPAPTGTATTASSLARQTAWYSTQDEALRIESHAVGINPPMVPLLEIDL